MQALVYEGPRVMEIREVGEPSLEEDDVLIEVCYSGICGSELSGYLGHNSLRKPPLIFGHEFSGKVADVGARAAQRYPELTAGAAVTANPLVTCGICRNCVRGMQQLCERRKLLSAALPGSNAKFVKVPARFVYALPDGVSMEQGALAEPIACAVRAAELAKPTPQSCALIVGMGPIGLFMLQALKIHNVEQVIVSDTNVERLEYARSEGAVTVNPKELDVRSVVDRYTDGRGADITIDAVGYAATRQACIQCAAPGGTAVFIGLHEADSMLPVNAIVRNEITCIGSFAYSTENFQTALKWLSEGKAGLQSGIVKAPLSEGAEWFERLVQSPGNVSKVLLIPS